MKTIFIDAKELKALAEIFSRFFKHKTFFQIENSSTFGCVIFLYYFLLFFTNFKIVNTVKKNEIMFIWFREYKANLKKVVWKDELN
jgi:hypothetical protein